MSSAVQALIVALIAGFLSLLGVLVGKVYDRLGKVEDDRTKRDESLVSVRNEVLSLRQEVFDAKQAHANDKLEWHEKELAYQDKIADLMLLSESQAKQLTINAERVKALEGRVNTLTARLRAIDPAHNENGQGLIGG